MSDAPRALVWATDLDVLPPERILERRDGYLVVRSPRNPTHWWGNFLLFDDPPQPGDGERWERLFADEFSNVAEIRHSTFAWDRSDGAVGAAREEFVTRGYQLDEMVGLITEPDGLRDHPRANREVTVRALDPADGADDDLWEQVVEVQVAGRDARVEDEATARVFLRHRQSDLREIFRAGRGHWYVALAGDVVAGSCGVVVTNGRGRFQTVDTAEAFRRRGICARLVVQAGRHAAQHSGARRLVIAADVHYHALGLYESLGFERVERVAGVVRPPGASG